MPRNGKKELELQIHGTKKFQFLAMSLNPLKCWVKWIKLAKKDA